MFAGCLIGITGLYLTKVSQKEDLFMYWGFLSVGLYVITDKILLKLNLKYQQRDFYLWLRGSNEINALAPNSHISWMDKVSSFIALITIVGLMLFGTLLFGKP